MAKRDSMRGRLACIATESDVRRIDAWIEQVRRQCGAVLTRSEAIRSLVRQQLDVYGIVDPKGESVPGVG